MLNQEIARTVVSRAALARMVLTTSDDAGMNACVACCDRWADGGQVGLDQVGLEWYSRDGSMSVRTFDAMRDDAARFANLLTARGVRPGDVVTGILPRGAEMLTVILGTWRAGAVFQPIAVDSSALSMEARINHTGRAAPKLVVTDVENRGTLGVVDYCPPVLVVSEGEQLRPGDGDFTTELMSQSANFVPVARDGGDPFILLVGGRGGQMRPVLPELSSLLEILTSIRIGLEPDEADTGWDVADPAWSFGLYYSVIRPLLSGDAATAHESDRVPSATPSVWAPADELPWMDDAGELEDVLLAA